MIRDLSAAALTASHYSILDHKLRRGTGQGLQTAADTYSDYGCPSSDALWLSLSCRVLSRQRKDGTGENRLISNAR